MNNFKLDLNGYSEEDKVNLSYVLATMSSLIAEGLVNTPQLYTMLGRAEADGLQKVTKSFINSLRTQLIDGIPAENVVGKYDFGEWCKSFV